jgi:hypothetical protein
LELVTPHGVTGARQRGAAGEVVQVCAAKNHDVPTATRGFPPYDRLLRVLAAFFAAADRLTGPLVRAAFFAAAERWVAVRLRALDRAWRESAFREAAERPSRLSALVTARDRLAAGRFRALVRPALGRLALRPRPFAGLGSFTPALRAFDSPIAMACLVERAPCFPSRT